MAIPKVVDNIINTCTQSAGPAIFLAGFSFYQIGRYDFTVGHDMTYIVVNTISFILSVIAAALSTFIQYYVERSKQTEYKIAFVRFSNNVFVRGNYQTFKYASIFYCLGLARIGYVYFPTSNMKVIPEVIFIVAAAFLYFVGPYVAFVQFSFVADGNKKNPDMMKEVNVPSGMTKH